MCTFMAPIASCVGGSLSGCLTTRIPGLVEEVGSFTKLDRKRHLLFYTLILSVGFFGLYLPLTFVCARADGGDWSLFKSDGECWSEGGTMPGKTLGLAAGGFIGVGFAGLLVTLCRKTKELGIVDVEKQDEARATAPFQQL